MTDIEALIVRLESATEGSRELDEAIATYVWGEPRPSGNVGEPRTLLWWHNGLGRSIAPEFTESVDAAMTLRPSETGSWELDWNGHSGAVQGKPYCATVYLPKSSKQYNGDAPAAPIALCIACLKARCGNSTWNRGRRMTESMVKRVEAAMTTDVDGGSTAPWQEPPVWMIYKEGVCVFSCPHRLERDAQLRKMNARAAIEAMREPTEAMINAAPDLGAVDFYPSDVWRAMIAAALAEETP